MKIDPLPGTQIPVGRGSGALSFVGGGDFASKLALGQIIKGRVLRSYEGGSRHLVDFSGQQKVVDSAVPLRPDEVIVGRVVGLGERVELQRINAPATSPAPQTASTQVAGAAQSGAVGGGKATEAIGALFERFQAQLEPVELGVLQRAVERSSQPDTMARSGLLLAKLGLPLSAGALRAVFDALRRDAGKAMFALPDAAIHLETDSAATAAVAPQVQGFATALSTLLNDLPERRERVDVATGAAEDAEPAPKQDARSGTARAGGGYGEGWTRRDADRDDVPDLARLILNVQSGGAVAHRVGTLPLLVDGRLVELNIALFEQPLPSNGDRARDSAGELRHRQVVFSVRTETLGRVEVRAMVAGKHMRVSVDTESEEASAYLARYATQITQVLEGLGWAIDELAYRTIVGDGIVARTVIEHLIAPGSVSTLA